MCKHRNFHEISRSALWVVYTIFWFVLACQWNEMKVNIKYALIHAATRNSVCHKARALRAYMYVCMHVMRVCWCGLIKCIPYSLCIIICRTLIKSRSELLCIRYVYHVYVLKMQTQMIDNFNGILRLYWFNILYAMV